jgi:hypothetical protein
MSAQTKTRAQKAGKFLGIALFAFLMFFNIKFAVSDNSSGDIDLFGLKISVFTNSTFASGYGEGCSDICRWVPDTTCTYLLGTGFCDGYWR